MSYPEFQTYTEQVEVPRTITHEGVEYEVELVDCQPSFIRLRVSEKPEAVEVLVDTAMFKRSNYVDGRNPLDIQLEMAAKRLAMRRRKNG